MKFAFIEQHRAEYGVQQMSDGLQVSSSGYYAWCKRPKSQREQANEVLIAEIRAFHQPSRETYGSPRIHADLRDKGFVVNRKRVARWMHLHGIRVRRQQRYQVTTKRHEARPVAVNLLAQDFTAQACNKKWLADMTYIDTQEGWL